MADAAAGSQDGTGLTIAVIRTRWNDDIIGELHAGSSARLEEAGATREDFIIPGAFELPLACKVAAQTGRFDAIIALGCVIRGETPHFDYVAGEAARGISEVSLATGVPVVFGVLTVNTKEQAEARALQARDNKGAEFAEAAIEMANFLFLLEDEDDG